MTRAAARAVSRRRLVGGGVAAAIALFRYPEPVSAGSVPEGAPRGFRSGGLDAVDAVVERGVAERAFPGAMLAIGRFGALIHLRAFGRLSYDEGAPRPPIDTIYDLASLTQGHRDHDARDDAGGRGQARPRRARPSFLPKLPRRDKDEASRSASCSSTRRASLVGAALRRAPGQRGLSRADRRHGPGLRAGDQGGLQRPGHDPARRHPRAPGGERRSASWRGDACSSRSACRTRSTARPRRSFRASHRPRTTPGGPRAARRSARRERVRARRDRAARRPLRHGARPRALRGDAAGRGARGGSALVTRATLELFTRRAGVPQASRALGWDTPADSPAGAARHPASPAPRRAARSSRRARSATPASPARRSGWIPSATSYVILLTNRVHPTRENNQIREVRADAADAAVRALADA